jgi:predicted transcriptional regulator with HTH domain
MKISEQKRNKISEHILSYLYSINPRPAFVFHISKEVARDEEFIKKLLHELKGKGIVAEIKKNSQGKDYLKRSRWRLTDQAYKAYKDVESR